MIRLDSNVEQIDLKSGPGATTQVRLGPPGVEHAFDVQLVGVPGPGLFRRSVTFENPKRASWPDAKAWRGGDHGALLEATVTPRGDDWVLCLEWAGRHGRVRVVWEAPEVTLHEGEPVAADPPAFDRRRQQIVDRVRTALTEWRLPTIVEVDDFDFDAEDDTSPAVEALEALESYACLLHQLPEFREAIVLELIAKYARVRRRMILCEHMGFLELYTHLTQLLLPTDEIDLRVPKNGTAWIDLAENCPRCAQRFELEMGQEAWPPHPPLEVESPERGTVDDQCGTMTGSPDTATE